MQITGVIDRICTGHCTIEVLRVMSSWNESIPPLSPLIIHLKRERHNLQQFHRLLSLESSWYLETSYRVPPKSLYFSMDNTLYSLKPLFVDLSKLFFSPMAIILNVFLEVQDFLACLSDIQVTKLRIIASNGCVNNTRSLMIIAFIICQSLFI